MDEAIELLTGITAGQRDSQGNYPAGSINGRVEAALQAFAHNLQDFDKEGKE